MQRNVVNDVDEVAAEVENSMKFELTAFKNLLPEEEVERHDSVVGNERHEHDRSVVRVGATD